MSEQRKQRFERMASVALDDGGPPKAPHHFKVGLTTVGQQQPAKPKEERKDDSDIGDDDEEDKSQEYSSWFSTSSTTARYFSGFFGNETTGAKMIMLMIGLVIYMSITQIGEHSSVTGYAVYLGINVGLFVCVFLGRTLWNTLVGFVFAENRVIPALNNLLDPELFILIWTFSLYIFWDSKEIQVFDERGTNTGYYRFRFIPISWYYQNVSQDFSRLRRLLTIVLNFWAIRNVLVEIFMYKILLGFLTNFRSSVLKYLKAYAILRRLNAQWIKLIPLQPQLNDPDYRSDEQNRTPINLDTFGDTLAENNPPGDAAKSSRRKKRANRQYHVQYTGRVLPTVLTKKNIDDVDRSAFANLLSITWIRANPTVLFIDGQRCELRSKRVAKAVARLLFGQLRDFRNEMLKVYSTAGGPGFGDLSPASPGGRAAAGRMDDMTFKRLQSVGQIIRKKSKRLGDSDLQPSPFLSPSPTKPTQPFKISISPEKDKPLADRLAQELGCRNDDDDSDDTDDDVEDKSGRAVTNNVNAKPRPVKIMNEDLIKSKDTDPLVKSLLLKRERGRAAREPSSAAVSHTQETFSDPVIDSVRLTKQPSAAYGTSERQPRRRTMPDSSSGILDPGPLAALRREYSAALKDEGGYKRLITTSPGNPRLFRRDASHSSAPPGKDERTLGQPMPHSTSVMNSEESESLDVFAVEAEAPIMMDAAAGTPSNQYGGAKPVTQSESGDSKRWEKIAEREMLKVTIVEPDDRECLDRDFFSLFVSGRELDELMETFDPGRLGKVTEKMFVRGVLEVHHRRRQMCTSLDAQKEIEGVFHRVSMYVLTFILFLLFLLVLGVSTNTIVVSGAAALSASGVILSFLYTDFILSIILIVFLNPYSIGDEVEINGTYLRVRRITTYFTEFAMGTGRIVYLAHKEIARMGLINQSRGVNVAWGLTIRVSHKTTWNQYLTFKRLLEAYLAAHPLEYKPNLFIFWLDAQPNRWVDICMWVTAADAWASPSHWPARSAWYNHVLKTADSLELGYAGDLNKVDLAIREGQFGGMRTEGNVSTTKTPLGTTPVVDLTQRPID